MSGCIGCLPTKNEIDQQISAVLQKAKKLAIEHEQNVFIYKTIDGQAAYMLEAPARKEGIIPLQVVSFL